MLVAAASARYAVSRKGIQPATTEFAPISTLMNDAIAAEKLPGGVVVIGHGGRTVFHEAYGSRTLAGEPGFDGSPAPAEPMTEDTIFDIASLTKPLATATAVMQLYEQGKVAFDDPVQTYLPDFNTANDPQRAKVTVRMLLTHTSGEGIDVSLGDPWGLAGADKTEGVHRALSTPLQSGPGEVFRYSDINYILLGALIEKLTGEAEDVYVQRNVFAPLGMKETRYLPPTKACGHHTLRGAAIAWAGEPSGSVACPAGTWSTSLLPRVAPTAIDDESKADPSKNPDFGYLLRGTVHDPTARRMGGVSGDAGVFSTAHDVSIYAAGPARSACEPPQQVSAAASDSGVDDDSSAARTQGRTGRSSERCRPECHCNDAKHHGSAARSATIRRSRGSSCSASAGISTRTFPSRAV